MGNIGAEVDAQPLNRERKAEGVMQLIAKNTTTVGDRIRSAQNRLNNVATRLFGESQLPRNQGEQALKGSDAHDPNLPAPTESDTQKVMNAQQFVDDELHQLEQITEFLEQL